MQENLKLTHHMLFLIVRTMQKILGYYYPIYLDMLRGRLRELIKKKKGLIDQANDGILFLDEVHRLPPKGHLNKAMKMVKEINGERGVLLLVDMGSLTTFSDIITEKTGIKTQILKMVSTPMVIEASRKAMMPNITMDMLVESVKNVSLLIGDSVKLSNSNTAIKVELENADCREYAVNMLEEILTFLSAKEAAETLDEVLKNIAAVYDKEIDDAMCIKFLFHCSCMIERVIRNDALPYKKFSIIRSQKEKLFKVVKNNFVLVEEVFGIHIPNTELAYIVLYKLKVSKVCNFCIPYFIV